jgi:glyoxylase-like metal-dependent hydrolase (beta-lactamase superfamily II)
MTSTNDGTAARKINVDVFTGADADVNAYVLSDGEGSLIIDCTRSSEEAKQVAALARSRGKRPKALLITHAHPDHYIGMGAMKREFPDLDIVVASAEIKNDLIGLNTWMAMQGWPADLEREAHMKPKSENNPNGFDYLNELHVLEGPQFTMPDGAVLDVRADFPAGEAPHLTTVYSKDLNALFSSDLVYNGVHLWLGIGVMQEGASNWKKTLNELDGIYGPKQTTIYPGHGPATDAKVFGTDQRYIDDLQRVISQEATEEDAFKQMISLYPKYKSPEFMLAMSIKNLRQLLAQQSPQSS